MLCVCAVYDSGSLFEPGVLDITEESLLAKFINVRLPRQQQLDVYYFASSCMCRAWLMLQQFLWLLAIQPLHPCPTPWSMASRFAGVHYMEMCYLLSRVRRICWQWQ